MTTETKDPGCAGGHDLRRGPGPTDFTFTVETVCVRCWTTGRVAWPSDIPAWTGEDYERHRAEVEQRFGALWDGFVAEVMRDASRGR